MMIPSRLKRFTHEMTTAHTPYMRDAIAEPTAEDPHAASPPVDPLVDVGIQHDLAAVEGLGVRSRRLALPPAQPQEAREQILSDPALVTLGREMVEQVLDLLATDIILERHEQVR
jgi:hypothetical protein